jgi:hypothetical protein
VKLAVSVANETLIVTKGGIEAVVVALNAHTASENLQLFGCMALANLTVNDATQFSIGAKGGIEAVVAVLNAHRVSENVQH